MVLVYMKQCVWFRAVSVVLKGGRPSNVIVLSAVYSTSLSSILPCDLQMDIELDIEVNLSGFCTDNLINHTVNLNNNIECFIRVICSNWTVLIEYFDF